jgi:N-acyl-D-amino-acid deacylase
MLAPTPSISRNPDKHLMRRKQISLCIAVLLLPIVGQAEFLIQNARIIDGTGTPEFVASVRVANQRITEIGDLQPLPGETVIQTDGRVLAPGFIDTHSHHDSNIAKNRAALAAVSQGITTIVRGQDGDSGYTNDPYTSLVDFNAMIRKAPVAVNIASFAGHNSIRREILGDDFARPASDREIKAMASLLTIDLDAGALGLSTGLEYEPGMYASTEEIVALASIAAAVDGRYVSHIRSEEREFWESIEETIRIGRDAGISVQISHIKLSTTSLWGQFERLLDRLNTARANGVDVTADIYPYTYWQSTVTVLFADRDFANRDTAEYVLQEIVPADGLIIARFEADPSLAGKNIAEIAVLLGKDPAGALMEVAERGDRYNKQQGRSTETVIAKSMRDEDLIALMKWPHTNIGSDGSLKGRHPRGAGTFPRVLAQYVRNQDALDLVTAIHKMTGLAARHIGITDRGVIKPGAFADLVLFDPNTVQDRATIKDPALLADGIERVWVNGVEVYRDGKGSGLYPGLLLARQSTAVQMN